MENSLADKMENHCKRCGIKVVREKDVKEFIKKQDKRLTELSYTDQDGFWVIRLNEHFREVTKEEAGEGLLK